MTVFPALSMLKTSASESYEIFVLVFFFILRSFTWIKRDDDFCVSLNFVHYAQDSSFIEANLCNQERQPTKLPSVGGVLCTERIPYQRERLTHRDRRLTRDKRTGDGASAFLSLESRNLS